MWQGLICELPAQTVSLSHVDVRIWNEHQDFGWQLVGPRGEELSICQCMTMTIISPFLCRPVSSLLSSSPPSLSSSLPVCPGVLSVPGPFLFMVQGFYLPKMIPLWRHEARQRGEGKKISLKKGSSAVNDRPGPSRVRTQRKYKWPERPNSNLERCHAAHCFVSAVYYMV